MRCAILSLIIFASSCRYSPVESGAPISGDTSGDDDTTYVLRAGAEFFYDRVRFDTIKKTIELQRVDTFVVVASGLIVEGKTNVSKLIDYQGQPYFIAYEANGDVSFNHGSFSHWLTFPIATKSQMALTIQEPGGIRTYTATYMGTEKISITGESLLCQKIRVDQTFNG